MRKIFINFGVVLFSFLVALGLAEGIVRKLAPQVLTSGFFRSDEQAGYVHCRDCESHQNRFGVKIPVHLNRAGLRSERELSAPKPSNEFRVLALGDSFTFGWLVEEKQTYVSLLEQQAQKQFSGRPIRFLNAGHGGYSTQNMLAFMQSRASELSADAVVLFFGPNDVEENAIMDLFTLEKDGQLTRHLSKVSGSDRFRDFISDFPGYQWLVSHSHTYQLVRQGIANYRRKQLTEKFSAQAERVNQPSPQSTGATNVTPYATRLTEALLLELKAECDNRKLPLLVAWVSSGLPETTEFWRSHHNWFQEHGFRTADVSEAIAAERVRNPGLFIPDDGHFSPEGHRFYVSQLMPYLQPWLTEALSHPL